MFLSLYIPGHSLLQYEAHLIIISKWGEYNRRSISPCTWSFIAYRKVEPGAH